MAVMMSSSSAPLVLTVLMLSLSCCSGQIECSDDPVLVFNPDGSIDFESLELPAGAGPVNPNYDPGPAGGWYALAAGFIDAVRPGSLPYDQIRSTLDASGVRCSIANCSGTQEEGSFDVQQTLTSFANWWIGLIIVTIIGGLLGVGFCITGMCFCCCRCCGHCGGKKTQAFSDNTDCKTFTFTILLLLFLALLFAGVVLSFFSNQQTFDSVGNAQGSISSVISDGSMYINDTIGELERLVCQLAARSGVVGVVIREAEQFNATLMDSIIGLENDVDTIGTTISFLAPGYNMTVEALANISSTSESLVMSTTSLNNSVMSIADRLDMLRAMSECSTTLIAICSSLPPSSLFQIGTDFNQLPNVTQELQSISDAIRDINFDSLVAEGRQTFEDIRQNIDSTLASRIGESVSQIESYNQSLFGIVDNLTSTVRSYIDNSPQTCPPNFLDSFNSLTPSVGYIRQCVIDGAFNQIQEYDVYRYAFGTVICSLSLVTILLTLVGIVMGMCGFRKGKDPDQRTKLSHCGGIFLLLGVVCTFIFGFVLLLLCCIFFFFGANAQKLCQAVQGPEYPLYTELIDNSTFWGGSIIGQYVQTNPDNPNPPEIYISGVLNNCENNTGLFAAANLSLLLPSGSIATEITSIINLNEIRDSIDAALTNATQDFDFNSTSFLPQDVQNSLEEFRNSSVDQINITAFREQIEAPLLVFNITEQIITLMDISRQLAMLGAVSARAVVDGVITDLETIMNVTIPAIKSQVSDLDLEVDLLVMLIETVVTDTTDLVDTIDEIIQNITGQTLPNFLNESVGGALDEVFSLLDNSIAYVDRQLTNNVGACQPLWGIYTRLYNTVCQDFLQGLNGFWWSLGFCALMFVPLIIFAVLTSNFYLKKKSEVEGYSGYEDYPMKSY